MNFLPEGRLADGWAVHGLPAELRAADDRNVLTLRLTQFHLAAETRPHRAHQVFWREEPVQSMHGG